MRLIPAVHAVHALLFLLAGLVTIWVGPHSDMPWGVAGVALILAATGVRSLAVIRYTRSAQTAAGVASRGSWRPVAVAHLTAAAAFAVSVVRETWWSALGAAVDLYLAGAWLLADRGATGGVCAD